MKTILLFLAITAGLASAAVDSTIRWNVRTGGAQTNGGGYKPGASGNDYSLQDAAQYALTGATSAGAGAVILHASAATDMVGNTAYVSGTNFTTGWYEITGVSAGVSITVDRNCTTGVGAAGVVNVGGAFLIGGTLDDDFFEAVNTNGGNTIWIKSGTYTAGEAISQAAGGTGSSIQSATKIIGYTATQGDSCTGTDRPFINVTTTLTWGTCAKSWVKNLRIQGATGNIFIAALTENCKYTNVRTSGGTAGATMSAGAIAYNCEFVSQNGVGLDTNATDTHVINCYVHDSDDGIKIANSAGSNVYGTVVANCRTRAIHQSGSTGGSAGGVNNCTLYGFGATPRGIGISITSNTDIYAVTRNTIIDGFATGMKGTTSAKDSNLNYFNAFYNNTANSSLHTLGTTDITGTNPGFVDVSEINGTTATSSASTLTQSGGNFDSVEDNIDYLHVFSGTGVTGGGYLITGHTTTTLTTNNALGTSAAGNIVYTVTTGHDFRIGTALKGAGYPGTIYGVTGAGSMDPGALQRVEPAAAVQTSTATAQ